MSHLTDEQIEQALQAGQDLPAHAAQCRQCRGRIDEASALQRRLRQAFSVVRPDAALQHELVAGLRAAQEQGRRPRRLPSFRLVSGAAAAAAVVLATVLVTWQLAGPRQAYAASSELAQIHQSNLLTHASLHGPADPGKAAEYFKRELGFIPALPRLGAGMELAGCCVAHFRNRPVGTYVIQTERGRISIIVLEDRPQTLKLGGRAWFGGRGYHTGAFARNRIAAVQAGGYTYCAVGDTDGQWLIELLDSLLAES